MLIVPNKEYPRVEGVQQSMAKENPLFDGACYAMCLLGPGLSSKTIAELLNEAVKRGFMMEDGWVLDPIGIASLGTFRGLTKVTKAYEYDDRAKLVIACLNNGEHFVIVKRTCPDGCEITYDPWRNSNAARGEITSYRLFA